MISCALSVLGRSLHEKFGQLCSSNCMSTFASAPPLPLTPNMPSSFPVVFYDYILHWQVLNSIPDEEFSIPAQQPGGLLSSLSQAVALPASMIAKWMRTDCLAELDLRGVQLKDSEWSGLVMSFSAVPGLQALHVRLPRNVHQFPSAPSSTMDIKEVRLDRPGWSPPVEVRGIWCTNCLSGVSELVRGSRQPASSSFRDNRDKPCKIHWREKPRCSRCWCLPSWLSCFV